jgi:hypothetical protein
VVGDHRARREAAPGGHQGHRPQLISIMHIAPVVSVVVDHYCRLSVVVHHVPAGEGRGRSSGVYVVIRTTRAYVRTCILVIMVHVVATSMHMLVCIGQARAGCKVLFFALYCSP